MKVNFAGSSIPDFDPLPAGQYHAALTDGELRDNKDGPSDKNPTGQHIHWEFTVQEGTYQGRKLWRNTPMGGNGVGFLKEVLAATGKFTDAQLAGDLDFEIPNLLNSQVLLTVKVKEDQNDVKKVRPYSTATANESLLPA